MRKSIRIRVRQKTFNLPMHYASKINYKLSKTLYTV